MSILNKLKNFDQKMNRPIPGTPDLKGAPLELFDIFLFAGALIAFAISYVIAGDWLALRLGFAAFLIALTGGVYFWLHRRRAKLRALVPRASQEQADELYN